MKSYCPYSNANLDDTVMSLPMSGWADCLLQPQTISTDSMAGG